MLPVLLCLPFQVESMVCPTPTHLCVQDQQHYCSLLSDDCSLAIPKNSDSLSLSLSLSSLSLTHSPPSQWQGLWLTHTSLSLSRFPLGFPKNKCADIMLRTAQAFCSDRSSSSSSASSSSCLTDIRFTNFDDETVNIFLQRWGQIL